MRCPFATWRPGPANKRYQWWPTNPKDGIVDHSAEGYKKVMRDLIADPNNEKSWTFSSYQDGGLDQHYEIEDVVWHCGYPGNLHYVGIEHEGLNEPLTEAQYQETLRLHRWLFEQHPQWGKPMRGVNLFEHKELWPTSCPSGRIPWARLIADLQEDNMDEATVKGIVDKALKPVLRSLELEAEKEDIRNSLEDWLQAFGKTDEDRWFNLFISGHIAWRLRGKPGWTVPA
jgi:N-acetyl-anhydromuramyl-L-alanine amidase AmpD